MGIAVEKLGIFDDLQSKGIKFLPKPRLVAGGGIVNRSAIEEAARQAVDEAIAEAVQRAIIARKAEIEQLSAPNGPPLPLILATVQVVTGFDEWALRGAARDRQIADARALFWYIAAALRRDLSYPALGKFLGGKDHTSAMTSVRRFSGHRSREPLATYTAHPAIQELLTAADARPRGKK